MHLAFVAFQGFISNEGTWHIAGESFTQLETLIETLIACLVEKPSYGIFIERRVPFLSEGTWLVAGESFKGDADVEDIVDLVVFLVLISCHLYLNLQRGDATYLSANLSFGGRQWEFSWAFSLMMGVYC